MFAGLRSRWMIALLVRRFDRLGNLLRDGQGLLEGIAPCAMRSASVGPSTSSITSAVMPPFFRDRKSARCSDGSGTRASGLPLKPRQPIRVWRKPRAGP